MNRINLAGRIKKMCFDKTGTLTENQMSFFGFLGIKKVNNYNLNNQDLLIFNSKIVKTKEDYKNVENFNKIFEILACCHNLSIYQG